MTSTSSGLTRRRFIGFSAGAAGGVTLGLGARRIGTAILSPVDVPFRPPGGKESEVFSVCRMCPGGCGVRVRCVGGRPVKVDGNPLHPISGGRLCAKGQAALQTLFHPDRLRTPLRRKGPRGALASFEPVPWEQALKEVGLRLSLLRQRDEPASLAIVGGGSGDLGGRLAGEFARAFGTPHHVPATDGERALAWAVERTQGLRAVPAYDVAAAEYVLSLGSGLLEQWTSPVLAQRAFGRFRRGREGRRGRLVQVESRLSVTGTVADERVRIRPGSEGLLALGLAAVLVGEDLHDKEFVLQHAHGLEDWTDENGVRRIGLRTLLEREFHLARVSAETGLSENVVLRLARELAAARPGLAIGPRRGPLVGGDAFTHLAVQVLNGLVGNVDGPGGVLLPEPGPLAPPIAGSLPADGDGGPRPLDTVAALAEALHEEGASRIAALVASECDPAASSSAPQALRAGLERVPLVVSLSSLPDETALAADWILPPAHFLETWDLVAEPTGVPFSVASLARPTPLQLDVEAPSLATIWLRLAREVGGDVAAAFPWSDDGERIRAEVSSLFEARRGAVMGSEFDEAWVRLMERAGWWAPGYESVAELWDRMQDSGGWFDPFYDHWNWSRVLRTESGRFELCAEDLERLLREVRSRSLEGRHVEGNTPARATGTLALHLFEPQAVAGGTGAEAPFLQEALDPIHDRRWQTWVELGEETAGEIGVISGDPVQVVSPHGSIRARAVVTAQIAEGVAALPVGLGKRAADRWSDGRGTNALVLADPRPRAVDGGEGLVPVRVRVVPEGAAPSSGRSS